jgi:hypothetical protein
VIARAVRLAQATSSTTSLLVLVAVNLVPLAGVILGHWNVLTLLALYWIENGIVGALNVPKILLAEGGGQPGATASPSATAASGVLGRAPLALFFLLHYGIFWVVHGVFVFALPTFAGVGGFTDFRTLPDGSLQFYGPSVAEPSWNAIAFGAIGLAISHTFSFVVNFLGRREYRKVSPAEQMARPYGRVAVLHLVILFGGFVSLAIGSPIGALLVLVVLKTAIDVALHRREHAGLAGRAAPA